MNVYLELTRVFNDGGLRAILSSGQAVVLHRLAIMSKDGDWIVRENDEALAHVRGVLAARGAVYRFGAPLDVRWLRGGWSAHFEFRQDGLRVRTDFVSRPPRVDPADLADLWASQESRDLPFVDARRLAELKKTNREKDYAVIGELARLLPDPESQLLLSRSARDLVALGAQHSDLARRLSGQRPLLARLEAGLAAVETALDAERRDLIHANEARLVRYAAAAAPWSARWPAVVRELAALPLPEAHAVLVRQAERVLPFQVEDPAR